MEQVLSPTPQVFPVSQGDHTIEVLALPEGWTSEIPKDPALAHTPEVIQAARTVADTASFKAYFNRFKDERTILFASRSKKQAVAELDYHKDAGTPAPTRHTLTRAFKADRRFAAWKSKSGQAFNQVQFVEFLEDRLADVIDPNQADLLKSIVQFKAFRTATCASAVDLSSGDAQFQFTQDTNRGAAGQAVLPDRITIQVPVLEFEREWQISARLKYRLNEGRLTFSFELIQIEDVEDNAFRTAIEDLSKEIVAVILLAD